MATGDGDSTTDELAGLELQAVIGFNGTWKEGGGGSVRGDSCR